MIENRGGETEGFALKKFFRVLALFSLVTSTVVSIPNSPVANAAVSDKCDGSSTQNNLKVTAQHGKIFYIDSAQGQNADRVKAIGLKGYIWK